MPPQGALDSLGLVRDGYPILIYFPAWDSYVPLLVKTRLNRGYEVFEYGPLPDCGSISGGVIPAGAQATGCTFPYSELTGEQASDMFYYTEKDKLYHVHVQVRPIMLRMLLEIPMGSKPYSFHGLVAQSLTRPFGWFRCCREMVFLPKMHVGWEFYNPTNMNLRTSVRFIYGEYEIEPIMDVDVLARILTGKVPYHEISFGGPNKFRELDIALSIWGAALVPRPPAWMSEEEIKGLISKYIRR